MEIMTDTKLFEVILGKDLKVGDIIVHDFQRMLVKSCVKGAGAGTIEFGVYISVVCELLYNDEEFNFWTYQECPMIKEM